MHDLAVRVLDADRGRALDPDKPLLEYGLDSLLAVELKNQLAAAGVDLPVARIMTGPPLSVVSKLVEDWIAAHPEAVAAPEPAVVDAPVRRGWDELSAGAGASGGSSAGEAPAPLPFNPVVSHLVAFLAGVFALIAAWVAGQVMGTHPVDNPDVGVEAPADARPALPGKAPVQKKKRGE